MSPVLSKNVVTQLHLLPEVLMTLGRELSVKAYYLVTSQKAITRDNEMTSLMGLKHSKSFLSLPEVGWIHYSQGQIQLPPQLPAG